MDQTKRSINLNNQPLSPSPNNKCFSKLQFFLPSVHFSYNFFLVPFNSQTTRVLFQALKSKEKHPWIFLTPCKNIPLSRYLFIMFNKPAHCILTKANPYWAVVEYLPEGFRKAPRGYLFYGPFTPSKKTDLKITVLLGIPLLLVLVTEDGTNTKFQNGLSVLNTTLEKIAL